MYLDHLGILLQPSNCEWQLHLSVHPRSDNFVHSVGCLPEHLLQEVKAVAHNFFRQRYAEIKTVLAPVSSKLSLRCFHAIHASTRCAFPCRAVLTRFLTTVLTPDQKRR